MKRKSKKLQLSRETLQSLSTEQTPKILGGTGTLLLCPDPPFTSDSVRYCCG
jgi:hypothetical protein